VERGAVIAVTPQMRVLVAIEPTDFRRGIDGLARLVRAELGSDPFSGAVFVFRNRRASAVKLLVYDGRGYWLCHKRLSSGRFRFWPKGYGGKPARALEAHELQVLVTGGDFEAVGAAPIWRPLA
jgi:transposase